MSMTVKAPNPDDVFDKWLQRAPAKKLEKYFAVNLIGECFVSYVYIYSFNVNKLCNLPRIKAKLSTGRETDNCYRLYLFLFVVFKCFI